MTGKLQTFRFEDAGSISPPGIIGRAARGVFGFGAFYWIYELVTSGGIGALTSVWVIGMTVFALQLLPYVINIGFGARFGFWPRIAALAGLGGAALLGWQSDGVWPSQHLWSAIFWLNAYVFTHLGVSFALAALFATPGCEMRAIPILLGRMFGAKARDHECPGPIGAIDRWEAGLGDDD